MARKKIVLSDPTNEEELKLYIDSKARLSTSRKLPSLLSVPLTLQPRLRRSARIPAFRITTINTIIAAAAHVRGEYAQVSCQNCSNGLGPFADCVILSSFDEVTKECCTNCLWNVNTSKEHSRHSRCSFAKGRLPNERLQIKIRSQTDQQPPVDKQCPPHEILYSIGNEWQGVSGIHLLGNLTLPPLPDDGRREPLQALLDEIYSDILALDRRDMTQISKSISDIEIEFNKFKLAEAQAWAETGFQPPTEDHLVLPSGSFSSPISHRLNQPSYTTHTVNGGETADLTNGCIAMVMGTAYEKDTLLYDQYHRRSETSEAEIDYPAAVLHVHKEWTQMIFESSESKVECLYGVKAQKAMSVDLKTTALPLWGPFEGVILLFVHENCLRNAQNYRFRKVLIPCIHPQSLFYQQRDSQFLTRQERCIAAASSIAQIHHVPGYYQQKLWDRTGLSSHQKHAVTVTRLQDQTLSPNRKDACGANGQPISDIQDTFSEIGEDWEIFFTAEPHSIGKLRTLLPSAIGQLTYCDSTWNHPHDLPPKVREWWAGQKAILFHTHTISSLEDVQAALHERLHLEDSSELSTRSNSSLKEVLKRLMVIQQTFLERPLEPKVLASRWEDFVYSRCDGKSIALVCIECRAGPKWETSPLFSVKRPDYFVYHRYNICKVCKSAKSSHRKDLLSRRFWVPQDESMKIVILGPGLNTRYEYQRLFKDMLRQATATDEPVLSYCIRCRKDTLLRDGSSVLIDNEPRWTLGFQRPLYLERHKECITCKRLGRASSGRFIPQDPEIPSICSQVLNSLVRSYCTYEDWVKAILLDSWPPSNRNPRR